MDARDTWSKLNAEAEETTRQIGKTSRAAVEDVVTRLRRFSASLSAATKSS
jgi:hypothetical protein